jgi:HEAT repeats
MLKSDVKRFEGLAAANETARIEAAAELQQLDRFHFDDHPIGKFCFSAQQAAALVSAWRATSSELLQVWIAQALALTKTNTPDALAVLAESLGLDGHYMSSVAQFLFSYQPRTPACYQLFRSLHRHPNPDVRWRSAMMLRSMVSANEFDYVEDMPILRTLMLDSSPTTRLEAVQAAEWVQGLGPADYEVLMDVANIDSGAARYRARELMAKLETHVSGCTPAAFAPREPLLRTDGISVVSGSFDVSRPQSQY